MRCGYCKTVLIEEVRDNEKRALLVLICPKCGQKYYYERI